MSGNTTITTPPTHEPLRRWAQGNYALEAAVELLIRTSNGRFADSGYPWIDRGDVEGVYWLDAEQLTAENTGVYSGGERRTLALVASLAGGDPVNLNEALPGLDRETLALVLAAVAHASGSHEHSNIVIDHEVGVARNLGLHPSLYPWPEVDKKRAP